MTCTRHPGVEAHSGHCAACLLEIALAASASECVEGDTFTILVPLGATDETAVFLARHGPPHGRLVRLKTWRAAASTDLLTRVLDLHDHLAALSLPATSSPYGAGLDAAGHLFVAVAFRQGIPLAAARATLTSEGIQAVAETCAGTLEALHAAGLVHGAFHGGNVLVHPATGAVTLLDTGMRPLLAGVAGASAEDDRRALAQLMQTLGVSGG